MNDNIFSCIPISLSVNDIFVEAAKLTDDEADRQAAVLVNIIRATADYIKHQLNIGSSVIYREAIPYRKLRHTQLEGSESDRFVISADMVQSICTEYVPVGECSTEFLQFKAYSPYGLKLTNSQAKLATKLIFLKEVFYADNSKVNMDYERLIRHLNIHSIISKINYMFNAKCLAEVVFNLELNGINVAA